MFDKTITLLIALLVISGKCLQWGENHDKIDRAEALRVSVKGLKTKGQPIFKLHESKTKLLLINLLVLSNDVQTNPGPRPPKYPCGVCNKAVTWKHKAICCDSCGIWFHTQCENMRDIIYDTMHNSNTSWECINCGMPNFSSTLFDLFDVEQSHNSFAALVQNQTSDSLDQSDSDPGPPLLSSSPTKTSKNKYLHKPHSIKRPLRILNINCQSIKNKIADFHSLISSAKPDIFIGTESWLKNDIVDSEIFPEKYTIYRKDRAGSKSGGGVFIGISSEFISIEEVELNTDCEILWAKITIAGCKALHICAYYRPDLNDEIAIDNFELSLNKLKTAHQHIIIGGDFNFPGWDWQNSCLKENCQNPSLHNRFGSILDDFGLTQIINKPTRGDNILDLIITNNPSLVNRTEIIPGISDHDGCYVEVNIQPKTNRQKPRQIPIYAKADWEGFKHFLSTVHSNILNSYNSKDANQLWILFRDNLTTAKNKFIPSKTSKPRDGLPWITPSLKKMMRKRDKMFQKHKTSAKYRTLKRETQQGLRKTYWDYIEKVITPSSQNPTNTANKKFWTYIKHCKTNNSGISPLKDNGILHSDPGKKADILNNQFKSVFTKDLDTETENIPQPDFPSLEDIIITEPGVLKLLQNLDPTKACGPDNISPKILKELANEIAPSLTLIFQKSYDTGMVPADWRHATVAPIFKKGEKYAAANY